MKMVTFDEAHQDFERVFKLAASGETVVIQRHQQRVALRLYAANADHEIAPTGYFSEDYSLGETAELNALASQAPQMLLP